LRQFVESLSLTEWLVIGACGLACLLVLFIWWLIAGANPRRRRAVNQLRKLLAQGKWADVLAQMAAVRAIGRPTEMWLKTFSRIEGQALQAASADRLAAKDFDAALTYGLQAARTLEENPIEPRAEIQNAILDEARRLFSESNWSATAPILELLQRAQRVQSPCREASFWEAMCYLRDGDFAKAAETFHVARTGMERSVRDDDLPEDRSAPASPILEPPLYLGALLMKQGKPKEAMRFFTEANRLDPSCPLVPLHLGCAMVESGGDLTLAVRSLQKALGPKGLGAWAVRPSAFWAEVYPESRSYVRKLASKYPFSCPLWGETPTVLVRLGQLALAQALQRQGQNKEAIELFNQVLSDGAPSLPVLRGLGLAQARLGQYDDAFKSLKLAYDLEIAKDRLTSGYLALCSAKAVPANPEDLPNNLTWALKTVTPFAAPGDVEWIDLISQIFAAVRLANVPLSLDDQLYLCEHLASVHACDASAAAAFQQMFDEHRPYVRPEYAFLYGQAIATHGELETASLPLLELALHDRGAGRDYFAERGWDFDAVERAYLQRSAKVQPGQVPNVLGDNGIDQVERLLLDGSRQAEERGDLDEARAMVEAFSRLVPHHPAALDRLASLHHRGGRLAQAVAALCHWHQKFPTDPLPLVRLGLVRANAGEVSEGLDLLGMAHNLAQGPARSQIALLAARLALQHWGRALSSAADASAALLPPPLHSAPAAFTKEAALARALDHLNRALADDPANGAAAATLAAVHWLKNDEGGLAALADRCRSYAGADPRLQYFAALALSAARDWAGVVSACRRVTHLVADKNGTLGALAIEAAYLEGVAQAELGDSAAAVEVLKKPAAAEGNPSAPFAQGLLGAMLMQQGQFDAATIWWQKLPAPQRSAWKIGEVLGGAQMLAALELFQSGRFELAADKFRQAGKLGCRDRRLGGLLLASLVKAGKQAVYGSE
jgi:tetratricopeptide (TPR) repeat protein